MEDSSGNKYYFYYTDSSVCLKEVSSLGIIKDTLLINQVNDNFIVTADDANNFYLVCCSKYKGISLLVYSDGSWTLTDIPVAAHVSNATLLDAYIVNGSIHIIYATPLPLVNFYNLNHLYNKCASGDSHLENNIQESNLSEDDISENNTSEDGNSWSKETIYEIYSENLRNSYAGTVSGGTSLELLCLRFDGKEYYINFSTFDSLENKWKHKCIVNLFDKSIGLSLLNSNDTLILIIYSNEDETAILFTFAKAHEEASDFEFLALNRVSNVSADAVPVFSLCDEEVQFEYIMGDYFFKYVFDNEQKDWRLKKRKSIDASMQMSYVKHVCLSGNRFEVNTVISVQDDENPLPLYVDSYDFKPPQEENAQAPEEKEPEALKVNNMDEFIPYLVEQIKYLSENVKIINQKLNDAESTGLRNSRPAETKRPGPAVPAAAISAPGGSPQIKSSNFREKFMNGNTNFSGFKQAQGKAKNTPEISGSSNARMYTPKTGFRENFISGEAYSNFGTSAVFYGSGKNAQSSGNSEPMAFSGSNKYTTVAAPKEYPNKNFLAQNEDPEEDENKPEDKNVQNVIESETAAETKEMQAPAAQETDQKKPNNLLKMLGDFFK